jgi:hypothetical protein
LLHIGVWAADLLGMPYDEWTPLQFDSAVTYFGTAIENKLHQLHPKTGKPLHRLEDLLGDGPAQSWHSLFAALGVDVRKV